MKTCASAIMIVALSWHSAAADAEESVLWSIGQIDQSYADLGGANSSTYADRFSQGVDFLVGRSDAGRDFSGIHPGPADAWAGHREHPFRIQFDLDSISPAGYELRIDLVDTHGNLAPFLKVRVNEQEVEIPLQTGAGDITLLHPSRGKPRNLRFILGEQNLRQGENEIELRIVRGSWLLYDAISLHKLPGDAPGELHVAVNPSVFFVERDGALLQEFSVSIQGVLSGEAAEVEVLHNGTGVTRRLMLDEPVLGQANGVVHVEPSDQVRPLTFRVRSGRQAGTVSVSQIPQRKWRLYVAPATHTDIGYTHIQDEVIAIHNRNTDLALELFEEFPLYHWNLESSWAAQVWLEDRPQYRHAALYDAAARRRMGIEASYLNMLTGLCSEEQLIRTMYYSARLHREHGVPFASYTLTDAPSHVWTVPSVLAGAGIQYLSVGINGTRAPILRQNIHHKSPFWWEGPDGQRILTWFNAGYAGATHIGMAEGVDRMRVMIERQLQSWNHRTDYPHDAILLHGAYYDNVNIGRDMAESVTEYNARYAFPKVIMCSNDEFFEYVLKHSPERIPTVRGCGGSWWEDGAGSTALETGINRLTHQDVIAAEAVWAVLHAVTPASRQRTFPQPAFDRIWDQVLLFDEHTWGAHNSITEPESDFVQRQWAVKASFATDAARDTQRLLDQGLLELAAQVQRPAGVVAQPASAEQAQRTAAVPHSGAVAGEGVLVFNPSGRSRTAVVRAQVPRGWVLMEGDRILPQQVVDEDSMSDVEVAFLAENVPALGYTTYRLAPGDDALNRPAEGVRARFEGGVLENEFYKVTFDPATGGVASLVDKRLGKELVDQQSPYKMGQLIYASGGGVPNPNGREGTQVECPNPAEVNFSSPTQAGVEARPDTPKFVAGIGNIPAEFRGGLELMNTGPVFTTARLRTSMGMFPQIDLDVVVYEHEPRVDFVFRLRKRMTYAKEAVYLAFPFAGANPAFRYEIGGASVRPNEDQFSGSCRDWFAVQRWVTVNTDGAGVAWSPIDTPLITLCDLTPGQWLETLPITNGTVFAYVMNNYWFTNYKAGQDGDFTFRYSLTSDASISPEAASLFGESAVADLRAIRLPPGPGGKLPPSQSLLQVEPANVTLTTLKRADDGNGLIVRVRETSGQASEARITQRLPGITQAVQCDLVERDQKPLPLERGIVRLKLAPSGMATVRLR